MKTFSKGRRENQLSGKKYITEPYRYTGMPSQCRPLAEHPYNTTLRSVGYFFYGPGTPGFLLFAHHPLVILEREPNAI